MMPLGHLTKMMGNLPKGCYMAERDSCEYPYETCGVRMAWRPTNWFAKARPAWHAACRTVQWSAAVVFLSLVAGCGSTTTVAGASTGHTDRSEDVVIGVIIVFGLLIFGFFTIVMGPRDTGNRR